MLIKKLKRRFRNRHYCEALVSREMDCDFYRLQTREALKSPLECARHYLDEGAGKSLDPTPYFSTNYYLEKNLDVKSSGTNPFVHYLEFGQKEGRAPHPNDKAKIWKDRTREEDQATLAALDSWRLIEIIKPHFDFEGYQSQVETVFETQEAAILHYVTFGEGEHLNPNEDFNTAYYKADNEDLAEGNFNLFVHYLWHGQAEGRRSNDAHLKRFNHNANTIRDYFDAEYYLSQKPNLTNYSSDPILNFLEVGYESGLNPNREFNSLFYQKMNADLAQADINGFVHYVSNGRIEGRSPKPYFEKSEPDQPLISVIIPNYNHAHFLPQRLESILKQTYKNIEVIILDDCSSDNSREVIQELVEKNSDRNIQTYFNKKNSGGVFNQWAKGIELAQGEYVWICESDDFCELNFLETLVPHFSDRSVNIAFGKIQFADKHGEFMPGMDAYRTRSEAGIWDDVVKRPAKHWFMNGFGVNNVVANVGGCVFRKPNLSKDVWSKAKSFKIAGDWFLYIHIAFGGQIVFDPGSVAYFRQHEKNTSGSNLNKVYFYEELAEISRELTRNWGVNEATRDKFLGQAKAQFDHWGMADQGVEFDDIFSFSDTAVTPGKLHIIVGTIGFISGGGEVFAINLANALKAQGHIVSMLALNMRSINESMYQRLDRGIAVYSPGNLAEYNRSMFFDAVGASIVHSNVVGIESLLFQFDRKNKVEVPYLVTLHGSYDGMNPDRAEVRSLMRLMNENVSSWVYTAGKNKKIFEDMGVDTNEFKMVENAMPLDARPYHKTRAELGIPEDAFVYAFVARGVEGKGWHVMIKAFQRLQKQHGRKAIHLIMVGNGVVAEEAIKKIRKTDSISYLGYESEINGIYRMSDCAVVPTRFVGESFPLCIIQAIQENLPIIATDHGEIKSMLSSGTKLAGELIEFNENTSKYTDDLVASMDKLYTNKKYRAGLVKNLSKTKSKFEMSRMISKYETLYAEAKTRFNNVT